LDHGIATEPGSGNRQLQEKAGGIDPDGLFSWTSLGRLLDVSWADDAVTLASRTLCTLSTALLTPAQLVRMRRLVLDG